MLLLYVGEYVASEMCETPHGKEDLACWWKHNFLEHNIITRSKKFSPKNKKDLGMACHIPPLKKAKKQGEMPLPSQVQSHP